MSENYSFGNDFSQKDIRRYAVVCVFGDVDDDDNVVVLTIADT